MNIPAHIKDHLKACAIDNGWRADEIAAWIKELPEDAAAYRDRVRAEAFEEARTAVGVALDNLYQHDPAAWSVGDVADRVLRKLAARSPATPGEKP